MQPFWVIGSSRDWIFCFGLFTLNGMLPRVVALFGLSHISVILYTHIIVLLQEKETLVDIEVKMKGSDKEKDWRLRLKLKQLS